MSDALTEVIYDQTSDNIDYDNENKYLLNDSTADVKDSRVPSQEVDHSGKVTEITQNIVVYSSDPNAPQFTAKKSVWSATPDFPGLEASETVHFFESDDPNATEQDIESEPEEEEEEPPQEQESEAADHNSDEGSDGTGESSSAGQTTGSNGKETTPKESPVGAGGGGDEWEDVPAPTDVEPSTPTDTTPPDTAGEDDTPALVEDASGNFTELPVVDHVAAVGQLAVIVQMIGGEGALVAADSDLLDSAFSAVFADEGSDAIVRGWSDDGSPSGIDMDAIEQSGAQLLLVDTPNFTESMPADQRKKLNALLKAGTIQKVVYADLSNTYNLKSFVGKVGQSLKDSTVIGNAGNTEAIANSYVEFHDNLVRECADNNGGLAYDTLNEGTRIYELGGNVGMLSSGEQLQFNAESKFTLLVDEWDSSVRYVGDDTWNPQMSGIALANVGFANAPVSYYIQAGGLVNNAAARGNASNPGLYPVWQIATLPVLKNSSYVSYADGGAFDNSVTPKKRSGGTSWDSILLTTSHNLSQGSANSGSSYGTELFPKIIAATQTIKREMIENSDAAGEVYHPFESLSDDVRGVRGYVGSDEAVYYCCIGATGATESVNRTIGDSISDADIVVNPHGLFSSWTEYGSAEGVLEAAWVNDVVNGAAALNWRQKVVDFYGEFYRYDCTNDLATIENGLAG